MGGGDLGAEAAHRRRQFRFFENRLEGVGLQGVGRHTISFR